MPNNKDKETAAEGAMAGFTSPREACQANWDLRREARDTTLTHLVAEAVAREMSRLMHSTPL